MGSEMCIRDRPGTDGACCTLPCPDKELTRLGIDEGSRVHLLPDGTLQKISEELL